MFLQLNLLFRSKNIICRYMADHAPSLKLSLTNVGKWTKSRDLEKMLKSLDLPYKKIRKPNGVDVAKIDFNVQLFYMRRSDNADNRR